MTRPERSFVEITVEELVLSLDTGLLNQVVWKNHDAHTQYEDAMAVCVGEFKDTPRFREMYDTLPYALLSSVNRYRLLDCG